jgi:GNAT superfamily N-acetyltransferase
MDIHIDFSTNYSDSQDLNITSFDGSINTYLDEEYSEGLEEPSPTKIGYITAHRINLFCDHSTLILRADYLGGNLADFVYFLLSKKTNGLSSEYLFYIDKVFIDPRYRSQDYGLKSLVIFLELFAKNEAVGCHPVPSDDLSEKYPKAKGKLILQKYWSKIGLDRYEKEQNILWTDHWYLPDWLREKVFESSLNECD